MALQATTKSSKRVTWARPLVEFSSHCSPVQCQQSSPTSSECDARSPSYSYRSAAESLRDVFQTSTPASRSGSRHDSLSVGNELAINALPETEREAYANQERIRARYQHREEQERFRYDQLHFHREQELLCRDGFYEHPGPGRCWTAACKFVDVLASRDIEPNLNYFFSTSDLLVTLFIHRDLTFWNHELLVNGLLLNLITDFPHVQNFRIAVFFPRDLVEDKWKVPECLKYLLGTFDHIARTATLEGAITEMEKKFVRKRLHEMRRRQLDHVQIHEDSLKQGLLVPRVDPDDVNNSPMTSHLLGEASRSTGMRPVDIVWPKKKDEVWKAPRSVWA